MTVFKTVFTTKWEIWTLDTNKLKRLGNDSATDWSEDTGRYGNIYNNMFFKTREAAAAWIRKDFVDDSEIVRI